MNEADSKIFRRFRKWREKRKWRQALVECRRAARKGYLIAKDNLDKIKHSIDAISADLEQNLSNLKNKRVETADVADQLQQQLKQVVSELYSLHKNSHILLEKKRAQLDKFSIALFGRTMSGKSTLMEILINGEGSSIGKGGQRTTRDVRSYDWKGLEVTDVPGIAAFEGREDEEKAFEAAAQSDLVLFLITDDPPKDVEAQCFARVRALGKPILGICNVKAALNDADDMRLFLSRNWFDSKRQDIVDIVQQFHEFAEKYSPGSRQIQFVYTHLQSRFLSQRPEHKSQRSELERKSCFNDVEEKIISEVFNRGKFLRWKSFIDGVADPMLKLSDKLLDFSAQNSSGGRVRISKRRQGKSWSDGFRNSGKERIGTLIKKEMSTLRAEIPGFAEDNYDQSDAGDRWKHLVERQDIERKAKKLEEEIQEKCRDGLSEITRQLKAELKHVSGFAGDRRISMDSIFDTKRAWTRGTNIISGGLTIASIFIPPLRLVTAVFSVIVSIFSLFFDAREEKARKQRAQLESKLKRNVSKIERNLKKELYGFLNRMENQVYVRLNEFRVVTSKLFTLADAQRELAWTLNKHQKSLHRILINEALVQLGHKDRRDLILDIARVPGLAIMFLIEPKTEFPEDLRRNLEKMLGEKIWFVINTRNKISILSQAIGRDSDPAKIGIESDIQVAHVPVGELDAVGISRIRLAQQLTELHVMK